MGCNSKQYQRLHLIYSASSASANSIYLQTHKTVLVLVLVMSCLDVLAGLKGPTKVKTQKGVQKKQKLSRTQEER